MNFNKTIKINNKIISINSPTFIIAEAAQGYEGNPEIAKLLVIAAAKAGADAIKFQIIYADDIAVPNYQYYNLFKQLDIAQR